MWTAGRSFLKMFLLDLTTSRKNWIVCILAGLAVISIFEWTNAEFNSFFSFLIFVFSTNVMAFLIFSESSRDLITKQYYLIPVHITLKYFSKFFLSIVIFPLLFFVLTIAVFEFWILIAEPVVPKSWFLFLNRLPSTFWAVWFFSQSISLLLGIAFKREKTMYAISVYFGLLFLSLPFVTIIGLSDFKSPEAAKHFFTQIAFSLVAISLLLLVFSYFLFKRRQL